MATTTVVTTVILIRHGERPEPTPTNPDPHLNAAGKARAKTLRHVLGRAEVKAIYTSTFVRTKETAQPLADELHLSPTPLDEPGKIKNDISSNHAGKTVLVVGHGDTVPELIELLGGGHLPVIENTEFDNLFVVTVFSPGKASVAKLKYGK